MTKQVLVETAEGNVHTVPLRQHRTDAAWDLFVSQSTLLTGHSPVMVPAGIKLAMPDGVWGMILPRSSTLTKRFLVIAPGVVDPGYRGELFISVWNPSQTPYQLNAGDRIAQLIFMNNVSPGIEMLQVDSVSDYRYRPYEANRPNTGTGSTGT